MKKLLIVYNPKSSQAKTVKEEVLTPARGLAGFLVGRFEVKSSKVEENIQRLATVIEDGVLVVAAGGDGTAMIAGNAVIKSGRQAVLAVLPYGNFNDTAGALGNMKFLEVVEKFVKGEECDFYPISVKVNGEIWRYAMTSATVGMAAEAAMMFDSGKNRRKLQRKKAKIWPYLRITLWYYRHRSDLGETVINGEKCKKITDILALNGPRMAKVMKTNDYTEDKKMMGVGWFRLKRSWPLFWFMMKSLFKEVPVESGEKVIVEFPEKKQAFIQADGESSCLTDIEKIEIEKSGRGMKVIRSQSQ